MANFEQLGDALERAGDFHDCLAKTYEMIAADTDHDRVRDLAEIMADRERETGEAVDEWLQGAPKAIVDTFVQFAVNVPPPAIPEDTLSGRPLLDALLTNEKALCDLYDHLEASLNNERARDAVHAIVALEKHKRRRYVFAALETLENAVT